MSNKNLSKMALLSALSLIFGYAESLLPPLFLPGVKVGVSNIVLVFAVFELGFLPSLAVMLVKVTASSLLFSGMNTFFYSLAGGLASVLAMYLCRKTRLSPAGVSIIGGVFHNMGQLLVAGIVLGKNALYYFPVLLISGGIMGFLIGIVATNTLRYIKNAMPRK